MRRFGRVSRRQALVGAAAALAVTVGVVLAIPLWTGGSSLPPPKGKPVRVALAELSPAQHAFADRVQATLDIVVDGRRVDPATVRPLFSLRPYRVVESERSVTTSGDTVFVRYRLVLDCLERACVPGLMGRRDIPIAPTVVFYGGAHGKVRQVEAGWPAPRVIGRVSPVDLVSLPLALDGEPLAFGPRYRHDPGRLAWLTASAAALLLLAAAALVAPPFLRRRQLVAAPVEASPDALRLALGVVESSVRPPPGDDRPQALDRLARELDAAGQKQLANQARLLAWRTEEIPPERVEQLIEACRRALREKAS